MLITNGYLIAIVKFANSSLEENNVTHGYTILVGYKQN